MDAELNRQALYTDETANYRYPAEPEPGDTVTIRFRAGKGDVDAIFLLSKGLRIRMNKCKTEGLFDYYEVPIQVGEGTVHYYFELFKGEHRYFYNERGVTNDLQEIYAFGIVPGFHTPDWAKGAVMYQIYVDRFCNGDLSNDVLDREYIYIQEPVEKVEDWYAYPKAMDVRSFYGGDLQGVLDKLDYLQDLGVEVIYMNPIFVSPSNHKYDCQDYDHIDPHYTVIKEDGGQVLEEGDMDNRHAARYVQRVVNKENLEASNAFFARFVEEVHRRGMKVILDGVFNHCGSFNKWLDRERLYEQDDSYAKGAYVSEDSPYRSFFKFNHEHNWPYNEFYDGWWGHPTLPKLCYENSERLFVYILGIAQKWLQPPYCVDGWRLDVAADLGFSNEYNHRFWKAFRKAVKAVNPNAVIYAEHYGPARDWLKGDEWDSVMNYDAFMEPLTWYLTGMEKHSNEFRPDMLNNKQAFVSGLMHNMAGFYMPSLQIAMNQLSNHDHSRFLTRTNHVAGRIGNRRSEDADAGVQPSVMREAVVFQMTWPGAPTLYYGDEAGLCGFTDPDNRRTYPWGREDQEMIDFHREMIRIHKENPVLKEGSVKFLSTSDQLVAFGRFDGENQLITVLNNQEQEVTAQVAVWEANVPEHAVLERQIFSWEDGFTAERVECPVAGGQLQVTMPPHSAMVFSGKKIELFEKI
ncbi:MAG: glycoside hydrolase family 13 protein [Lachnospiraceae bacterium]|nr:glycoside hydrolase family 13 protein [Lachnospiraceae bacterium]